MKDARLFTISIPQASTPAPEGDATGPASRVPARVCEASAKALRVVVRNVSFGSTIDLAFDKASLQSVPPTADHYELPAGGSDVIVLGPHQALFASSTGVNARLSVNVSELVPTLPGFEKSLAG